MLNNFRLLILSVGVAVIATYHQGTIQAQESQILDTSPPASASDGTLLTPDILRNETYHLPDLGSITLTNGTYQKESVAAQMTNLFAFGDLNGDQRDDAAVLIQVNHDSGTFAYLAAVVAYNSNFENVDTIFLGNWQDMTTVTVNAGQISVEMGKPSADDSSCCLTEKIVQTYRFNANINRLTGISLDDEPLLEEAENKF